MTYCGAIGSVNVLEFMSTELFDESQENPFLLKAPVHDAVAAAAMGASSSPQRRHSLVSAKCAFELPLHDPQQQEASDYHHQHGYMNASSPTKVYHHQPQQQPQQYHQHQQHDLYYQSAPTSPVPAPPSSPSGRASVTFNLPKSILKRQSSYDSDSSTVPPSETDYVGVDVSETELHKLLYSLARFSVASEASVADNMSPSPSPQPQRQYSISQPMSPNATLNSTSPWLKGSNAPPPSPMSSPSKAGHTTQDRTKPRSPSSSVKKSKARSKSADRGYETDPETFATSDEYESEDDGRGRMAHSRGSVSFETVKNLLRGGGSGARASRIVKRSIPDLRRKSMGTVSSRLKRRQKFARPTILTDAYHRVYVPSSLVSCIPPFPICLTSIPVHPFLQEHDEIGYQAHAGQGEAPGVSRAQ